MNKRVIRYKQELKDFEDVLMEKTKKELVAIIVGMQMGVNKRE